MDCASDTTLKWSHGVVSDIKCRGEHSCFGGRQGFYSHMSVQTQSEMAFSVFVPAGASRKRMPAVYYLAGLTCTDETFVIKAGAQRVASELGLILVTCDTSPRGSGYPGETDSFDFGAGAGFYIDATEDPWSKSYRMSSYVNLELPELIEGQFPAERGLRGIFGHSMGGHGALVSALRYPSKWKSLSAFSPICNPSDVPWGKKAFSGYLGTDAHRWDDWDATILMRNRPYPGRILVDQGLSDQFLSEQLKPEALEAAAAASGQKMDMRKHAGYDHGYYFIQTFVADHLAHHASVLLKAR